jgi:hypothetical protein
MPFDREYYGVAGYNAFVLGNKTSVCTLPANSDIRKWWLQGFAVAKKRKATQCITTKGADNATGR